MRGAPITIRCDCGEARDVRYGHSWTCEACGKTWNTSQIPSEEYWGVMRRMRRYRLTVWGLTGLVLAIVLPLAVLVAFQLFVFAILILGGLYFYVLPRWRGKVLAQMRDRPSWKLRPE